MNASPDLRQQIEASPALQPQTGLRSSPIAGVVLTGGDVDAIAGLLTLRERQPLTVYATGPVHAVLDSNSVFEVLARDVVRRERLTIGVAQTLELPGGAPSGLTVEFFAVPGKVPLYLEGDDAPAVVVGDQTVGARISDGARSLFYIPGCARMTDDLRERLRGASVVFFDGTLWDDEEMVRAGLGAKTGRRMGHMSVSGAEGVIASFDGLGVERRIFIHINNSNPILIEDTPERRETEAAGWEVSYDGMQVMI